MSNLFKYIKRLERKIKTLETKVALLENNVDHLETLLRLKDQLPERPFYPRQPELPWYKYKEEPFLKPPYEITCDAESQPMFERLRTMFGV